MVTAQERAAQLLAAEKVFDALKQVPTSPSGSAFEKFKADRNKAALDLQQRLQAEGFSQEQARQATDRFRETRQAEERGARQKARIREAKGQGVKELRPVLKRAEVTKGQTRTTSSGLPPKDFTPSRLRTTRRRITPDDPRGKKREVSPQELAGLTGPLLFTPERKERLAIERTKQFRADISQSQLQFERELQRGLPPRQREETILVQPISTTFNPFKKQEQEAKARLRKPPAGVIETSRRKPPVLIDIGGRQVQILKDVDPLFERPFAAQQAAPLISVPPVRTRFQEQTFKRVFGTLTEKAIEEARVGGREAGAQLIREPLPLLGFAALGIVAPPAVVAIVGAVGIAASVPSIQRRVREKGLFSAAVSEGITFGAFGLAGGAGAAVRRRLGSPIQAIKRQFRDTADAIDERPDFPQIGKPFGIRDFVVEGTGTQLTLGGRPISKAEIRARLRRPPEFRREDIAAMDIFNIDIEKTFLLPTILKEKGIIERAPSVGGRGRGQEFFQLDPKVQKRATGQEGLTDFLLEGTSAPRVRGQELGQPLAPALRKTRPEEIISLAPKGNFQGQFEFINIVSDTGTRLFFIPKGGLETGKPKAARSFDILSLAGAAEKPTTRTTTARQRRELRRKQKKEQVQIEDTGLVTSGILQQIKTRPTPKIFIEEIFSPFTLEQAARRGGTGRRATISRQATTAFDFTFPVTSFGFGLKERSVARPIIRDSLSIDQLVSPISDVDISSRSKIKTRTEQQSRQRTIQRQRIIPTIDIGLRSRQESRQEQETRQRQRTESLLDLFTGGRTDLFIQDPTIPKVPKVPPRFDFDFDLGESNLFPKKQAFDVLVREGETKGDRFVKANTRPLPRNKAKNFGAGIVDNTTAATFKLVKSKKTTTTPDDLFFELSEKFSKPSSRSKKLRGNVFVEKNKNRIDTLGELMGIPFKAKRLRQERGLLAF